MAIQPPRTEWRFLARKFLISMIHFPARHGADDSSRYLKIRGPMAYHIPMTIYRTIIRI